MTQSKTRGNTYRGIHVTGTRIDNTWLWCVLDCMGKLVETVTIVGTQRAAIVIGRVLATRKRCELVVHGKNGRIRQKDSFGRDPRSVKG